MKYILNDHIQDDAIITIPINDRGLQFGDGLFETIIVHNLTPKYLKDHLDRLKEGAKVLGLVHDIDANRIVKNIGLLCTKNSLTDYARIKLMIWRKPSSIPGYATTDNDCYELITAHHHEPANNRTINSAGFSKSVRTSYSSTSKFKTISALRYVIATQERDSRKLDELILCDVNEHISECTASNIFWIKNNKLYTPHISTGCIKGIMRKQVMKAASQLDIPAFEVNESIDQLMSADMVFTCNASGLTSIKNINKRSYNIENQIYKSINLKIYSG